MACGTIMLQYNYSNKFMFCVELISGLFPQESLTNTNTANRVQVSGKRFSGRREQLRVDILLNSD